MADLTLYDRTSWPGDSAFVPASAGGDRAPNRESLTQIWIAHQGAPLINLSAQSIDVANALGRTADLVDAAAAAAFSAAVPGMLLDISGFSAPGNDGVARIQEKVSDDEVRVERLWENQVAFTDESGETDIVLLQRASLTLDSNRASTFGTFPDLIEPITFGAVTITDAYDGRRFNDLEHFLTFQFDDVTNVSIAARRFGVRYND